MQWLSTLENHRHSTRSNGCLSIKQCHSIGTSGCFSTIKTIKYKGSFGKCKGWLPLKTNAIPSSPINYHSNFLCLYITSVWLHGSTTELCILHELILPWVINKEFRPEQWFGTNRLFGRRLATIENHCHSIESNEYLSNMKCPYIGNWHQW